MDETTQDQEPIFDEDPEEDEEELYPDTGRMLVVRRSCLAPKAATQFPQRNKLFQSRCTIDGRVCSFVIDSGSCENVIVAEVFAKLDLKDEPHPTSYKLAWLQQIHDLMVTRRALVSFSIANSYKDQAYCDIAPMDACHLLLGRPWEFDRRVVHDSFLNTSSFTFSNRKFVLKPSPDDTTVTTSNPVLFLRQAPFISAMRDAGLVFALIIKPTHILQQKEIPLPFTKVISEFSDVFPSDLPDGLPPLCISSTELIFFQMQLYLTAPITV